MIDHPAMLYATITLDLPSHPALREPSVLEWLAQLIGRRPSLETGEEVTTIDGVLVFRRVIEALSKLALEDVLSIRVDGEVAFVDLTEDSGDLPAAIRELETRGLLGRGVKDMRLILSELRDGLRVIAEVELRRRVAAGTPELRLKLHARIDSMLPRVGESPRTFAERLRELAQDGGELQRAYARFENLAERSADALQQAFKGVAKSTARGSVALRIYRPGPVEIARMRRLSWGPAVERPRYHAVPRRPDLGEQAGAFERHYYDPYFNFACWVTLGELVEGRGWRGLEYTVDEADGGLAFTHEDALGQRAWAGEYEGLGADEAPLRLDGDALVIHSSVAKEARESLERARAIDPRDVTGYGGDDRGGTFAAQGEGDAGTGEGSCGS